MMCECQNFTSGEVQRLREVRVHDLREELVGEVEVIHGDTLRTLEEKSEEFETGRLAAVRFGIEGLLLRGFRGGYFAGEVGWLEGRLGRGFWLPRWEI
ncbi:hypothetical protein D0Y65_035160 [Glycine soja]|uniref:Uncharacterized protein n=1 Tax=Glycine soja TaxID=3848 RepID=A0A445HTR0_GLYSO|nr:hypothetical protein JHK87_034604 [Glycine soja]RZB77078.1 hypothetical protein D0Y65_035160 [Glycine soja]